MAWASNIALRDRLVCKNSDAISDRLGPGFVTVRHGAWNWRLAYSLSVITHRTAGPDAVGQAPLALDVLRGHQRGGVSRGFFSSVTFKTKTKNKKKKKKGSPGPEILSRGRGRVSSQGEQGFQSLRGLLTANDSNSSFRVVLTSSCYNFCSKRLWDARADHSAVRMK